MTTNNSVNVVLSGASGTGSFAGTTSPSFTTPTLGAATATSIAFSPTTSGIIGTNTNDNAGSGKVGETVSSFIVAASAISLSSGVAKNLTSISLTAGDWDVWGNVGFVPATTTNTNAFVCWLSASSATLPDQSISSSIVFGAAGLVTTSTSTGIVVPYQRFSLSGTTTVYISAQASFSVSTMTMCGNIWARRAR